MPFQPDSLIDFHRAPNFSDCPVMLELDLAYMYIHDTGIELEEVLNMPAVFLMGHVALP
jgi:hypothetical protein